MWYVTFHDLEWPKELSAETITELYKLIDNTTSGHFTIQWRKTERLNNGSHN